MIRSIKQNLTFRERAIPQVYQGVANTSYVSAPQPQIQTENTEIKKEKSKGNIFHRAKIGIMNLTKGFNNIKGTSLGFMKGLGQGLLGGIATSVIGADIIKAKSEVSDGSIGKVIAKTIGNVAEDVVNTAIGVIEFIPKLFSSSKKEILNTIKKIPSKFISYLSDPAKTGKNSKKLIIISSLVALGFVAYRTIEGKIKANLKNAGIDHALNEGHVPTK